ncbi:MAG: glutaredoxin family protein [Lentisphaeria bacterium]|nr:MAG: glutaredoxin family protein [Lentisphaeria bacterium]
MLKVYAWNVCPHCRRTVEWLKAHEVPYEYLEIEEQPPEVVRKVVEVNGGDDWVVPTLEYNGKWRPGKVFDAAELEADLRAWGVIS